MPTTSKKESSLSSISSLSSLTEYKRDQEANLKNDDDLNSSNSFPKLYNKHYGTKLPNSHELSLRKLQDDKKYFDDGDYILSCDNAISDSLNSSKSNLSNSFSSSSSLSCFPENYHHQDDNKETMINLNHQNKSLFNSSSNCLKVIPEIDKIPPLKSPYPTTISSSSSGTIFSSSHQGNIQTVSNGNGLFASAFTSMPVSPSRNILQSSSKYKSSPLKDCSASFSSLQYLPLSENSSDIEDQENDNNVDHIINDATNDEFEDHQKHPSRDL